MRFDTLLFDHADGLATITMNRPDAANAMDINMSRELMLAAIECDENPAIRAVLITGSGKMFSAGGDLKAFAAERERIAQLVKEMTVYLHGAISRFARMDPPVIMAVNGTAAGAGMSLAVSGDIVLVAESARMTMAYTAAALSPDGSSSYFLPRVVGLRRAAELMLTNRRLDAAELLDWGIATRVVAEDRLAEEARALGLQLASGPTRAFGGVKKLLAETFTTDLEAQMEYEARCIADMMRTDDGNEGIDAFLAKRRPGFKGR